MTLLLASLIWLSSIPASGLKGEFLLVSKAETVVVILNSKLDGNSGCYLAIDTLIPRAYVYNEATGDWMGSGVNCDVEAKKEGEGVRLSFSFSRNWKGKWDVFVIERPTIPRPGEGMDEWRRAGTWEVQEEALNSIPPNLPSIAPVLRSRVLTREADGRYGPYSTGLITRNGVVQTQSVDYTVIGAYVTPAFAGWGVDDLVVLWSVF